MFLNIAAEVNYSEPFGADFHTRLYALQRRRLRVAYYYDYPDSSTFRYRVYNSIQALWLFSEDISSSYFCYADGELLDRVIDVADVLVFCRSRYTNWLNKLITRAKSLGRRVIFDVDDFVFDINYANLIMHTLDVDMRSEDTWNYWFSYISRISATMKLCEKVTVTNEALLSQVRKCFSGEISIVPNTLNSEQIELSDKIFEAKKRCAFRRDDRIHIGYFSGSPSHNKDFEIISHALARLLNSDKRVILRIVGYLDLKGALNKYDSRIERYPMQDYLNLQLLIGSTEINVVPLQENVFTSCKSDLKYFEAACVGTASLVSPTYAFSRAVTDGQNGLIVHSHEWDMKLNGLVADLDCSVNRYIEMAERAREHAKQEYSPEKLYHAVRCALLE
jgi:glycosyltransferase involved in cell wall biosynthesis